MLLNYHEMTMNQPRDSPQQRRQFLVICTVMAAVLVHSILTSGGLLAVTPTPGIFPGGTFVYKYTQRDYAASMSMQERIGKDVGLKVREFADKIYCMYLDNPNELGGRQQRFACGYLITQAHEKPLKKKLLDMNAAMEPPSAEELKELGANSLWPRLPYHVAWLPSVNSLVVNFAFTNGFVSAMVHSLKIIPALRRHVAARLSAKDNAMVVVVTTCSTTDSLCTHYAPLRAKKFLLGQPPADQWLQQVGKQSSTFTFQGVRHTMGKVLPPLKWIGLA